MKRFDHFPYGSDDMHPVDDADAAYCFPRPEQMRQDKVKAGLVIDNKTGIVYQVVFGFFEEMLSDEACRAVRLTVEAQEQ